MPTLVSNVVLLPSALDGAAHRRLAARPRRASPSSRPRSLLTRWFQHTSHVALVETRNRIAAVTAQIAESVSGMAVVQAFNRERAFQAQFDELNAANREQNVYAQKIFSVFFPSIEFLGVIATGAVLFAGEKLLAHHALTIGTLITALYLLQLVFQPLQELSDVYGQLQSGAAAMVKIAADPRRGARDQRPPGRAASFRASRATSRSTTSCSRTAPSRCCTASTSTCRPAAASRSSASRAAASRRSRGSSAGSTTPTRARCASTASTCASVKLRSYRRQLGVVLQDPFLFSGTIASNIRFAKPDATDEEVASVAAAVGVDRVAARLSGGLDHAVREGGSGLSAGERQLISIARALLADPRILILDEATSNIDRPTEVLVERALDRLLAGRTSIIIAHRLSTVRRADEIVVVEHGQVAQRGAERELLAEDGPFRRLAVPRAA